MNQEQQFANTLEEIKRLAKNQGNCVGREQVKEAFLPLGFDEKQLEMVFEYLKEQKIGIGEPLQPEDYLSAEEINYLDTMAVEMLETAGDIADAQGMLGSLRMEAMESYIALNVQEKETGNKMAEKVNQVAEQAKELAESLGRKVTMQELADETGMTLMEIMEAVQFSGDNIEDINTSNA